MRRRLLGYDFGYAPLFPKCHAVPLTDCGTLLRRMHLLPHPEDASGRAEHAISCGACYYSEYMNISMAGLHWLRESPRGPVPSFSARFNPRRGSIEVPSLSAISCESGHVEGRPSLAGCDSVQDIGGHCPASWIIVCTTRICNRDFRYIEWWELKFYI